MADNRESSQQDLFSTPAVHMPSIKRLDAIARQCGLDITEHELKIYQDLMKPWFESCKKVDQMVEPTLPVKYPRTPGYRPKPEENKFNAWYYKTDIKGADSGKLHGKTVAIKDNIAVAGVPLSNGSPLMEGYIAEFDATVVTRILDAGGVIKGKSACENMCFSGSSYTNSKDPVLNPHDPERATAGSSSGSAVLVQIGEVDMAIGGDQGGSIRLPSCWTGTVGLKPTFGLVPYTGAGSLCFSVDHLGPMARTVHDCALLLEVIAGTDDGYDFRQPANLQVPEYTKCLTGDLKGIRVGIVPEGFIKCEPDVGTMVKEVTHKLTSLGASVAEVSVPLHEDGHHIWVAMGLEGVYECTLLHAGAPVGASGFSPTSMKEYQARALRTRQNDLIPALKLLMMYGEYMRQDYNGHFSSKGTNLVRTLRQAYDTALRQYDVLVMPTIKFKATKIPPKDVHLEKYVKGSLEMVDNTCPINATGHPALNVNAGFSEGLPVGLMIIGRHFDETTVLRVGHGVELVRGEK